MIRGDPFCYVLFTEFGISDFPLYVLVRLVHGCLLYSYLTVGQRGVGPHGTVPRQMQDPFRGRLNILESVSELRWHNGCHLEGVGKPVTVRVPPSAPSQYSKGISPRCPSRTIRRFSSAVHFLPIPTSYDGGQTGAILSFTLRDTMIATPRYAPTQSRFRWLIPIAVEVYSMMPPTIAPSKL